MLNNEPIRNNISNNTHYLSRFNTFIFQQLEQGKNHIDLLENENYNLIYQPIFERYYHNNYLELHIASNLSKEVKEWIQQHKIIFAKKNLEKQLSDNKTSYKKMKI